MRLGWQLFRGLTRRNPARLLLIALCAMFCFTGQLGLSWAGATITGAREEFDRRCGVADIIVYTENTQPGTLETLFLQVPGVEAVSEGVLTQPVSCDFADGTTRSVRFFSFLSGQVVRPILTGEGDYFLSYGYKTGFPQEEILSFTLPGGQQAEVTATAAMPMYTGVYVDRFVPSTDGDMVDIYAPAERVQAITGESYVNYAAVRLTPGAAFGPALEAIAENDAIFVAYAAGEEPAYAASVGLQTLILRMCALFPWVMLLVGLLFISVFLAGVAGRASDSISLLRTEGASVAGIYFGICLFGLSAVLAGFLCALPAAAGLSRFIARISLGNMGIPAGAPVLSPVYPLTGLAAGVALSLVASLLGMLAVSGSSIAGLRSRHISPRRSRLRCVFITAVSSAAAVCMTLIAMFFLDSLDAVRQEQFTHRYGYDAQVVYSSFAPLTRLEELQSSGYTQQCAPMLFGTAYLYTPTAGQEVTCVGLSDEPLLRLQDQNKDPIKIPENGIVLSSQTAEKLELTEGDLVNARIRYGSAALEVTCAVAGISEQSVAFLEGVSIKTVEQYLNSSGVMNSVAVTVRPGCLEAFCRYARSLPGVESVQTGQAGQQRFDRRYSGTRALIWVVIAAGAMLGFSVCLLMCYRQWRQDIRRDTVLHLLGEAPAKMMLRSGLLRLWGFVPGLAAGTAAAVALMPRVLEYLKTDAIRYPLTVRAHTLLWGIGLCLIFEAGCQSMYYFLSLRHWKRPGSKI